MNKMLKKNSPEYKEYFRSLTEDLNRIFLFNLTGFRMTQAAGVHTKFLTKPQICELYKSFKEDH